MFEERGEGEVNGLEKYVSSQWQELKLRERDCSVSARINKTINAFTVSVRQY